jgi:peroxiredoxin
MTHPHPLPANLPVPEDDGACDHLPDMTLPAIPLVSTAGSPVTLADLPGRSVVFCYPRTAAPNEQVPDDWNAIPGARGCTPESCAFRDLYGEFQSLGVDVYGLSAQPTAQQREARQRLHLPYPLLSDADLVLTTSLRLPTFAWRDITCIRRLTLIVRDGTIEHVFYPVFPPDTHADAVLAWLRSDSPDA